MGGAALDGSARRFGAFTRPRGVRDASGVLRLCLMYGPGGLSLRALAATAAQLGIADMSDVAVMNRIRGAADWLEALCGEQLARNRSTAAASRPSQPASAPPSAAHGAGRAIRIIDSSLIGAPGGVKWRLHASYDPLAGRLAAAAFTGSKQGERLDRLALDSGDIAMADRGFPQPDGLSNTAAQHADPLVRVTWNSVTLTGCDDHPLDWPALCRTAALQGGLDMPVRMHKRTRRPGGRDPSAPAFQPVAMRLVVLPHPAGAAAHALAMARAKNRDGSRNRLDPRTVACADHLMLLTTLPADVFPPVQISALYRLRWQIELAFKRMKSLMHIDKLPARDPQLAKAWLYAHLLVALITEQIAGHEDAVPP